MPMVFEITTQDVLNVARSRLKMRLTEPEAEKLLFGMDIREVERAAFDGHCSNSQIRYAYDEMARQMATR